ncbi:Uncharacterised protein [Mycobacteroides abscessus subsp. abscessus]|nr:Uncharacterised protein [Mycobacteroides abscessus subsp. abscessus]
MYAVPVIFTPARNFAMLGMSEPPPARTPSSLVDRPQSRLSNRITR